MDTKLKNSQLTDEEMMDLLLAFIEKYKATKYFGHRFLFEREIEDWMYYYLI